MTWEGLGNFTSFFKHPSRGDVAGILPQFVCPLHSAHRSPCAHQNVPYFQHPLNRNHWFPPGTMFFSAFVSVSGCSLCSPGFLGSPEACHSPSSSDAFSPNTQSSFSTNEVLNLGFLRDCHWGEAVANEVQIGGSWGGVALSGLGPRRGVKRYDTSRGGWPWAGKPDSWPGEASAWPGMFVGTCTAPSPGLLPAGSSLGQFSWLAILASRRS